MALSFVQAVLAGYVPGLSAHFDAFSKRHKIDKKKTDPNEERGGILPLQSFTDFRGFDLKGEDRKKTLERQRKDKQEFQRYRKEFYRRNRAARGKRKRDYTAYDMRISMPDILQVHLMVLSDAERQEAIDKWIEAVDQQFVDNFGDIPRQFCFHSDTIRLHASVLFLRYDQEGKKLPGVEDLNTRRRDLIGVAVYAALSGVSIPRDFPTMAHYSHDLTLKTMEVLRPYFKDFKKGISASKPNCEEITRALQMTEALGILHEVVSDETLRIRPAFHKKLKKYLKGENFVPPGVDARLELSRFLGVNLPEPKQVARDLQQKPPRWLQLARGLLEKLRLRRSQGLDQGKKNYIHSRKAQIHTLIEYRDQQASVAGKQLIAHKTPKAPPKVPPLNFAALQQRLKETYNKLFELYKSDTLDSVLSETQRRQQSSIKEQPNVSESPQEPEFLPKSNNTKADFNNASDTVKQGFFRWLANHEARLKVSHGKSSSEREAQVWGLILQLSKSDRKRMEHQQSKPESSVHEPSAPIKPKLKEEWPEI